MCALRQYDFILIFVWVTSREHSRMVLIQVLPQCNGISLNYTAMDKHTRGFLCGSTDVSLPSYELMKSFKINWQDGVHLWSTVGQYISSVFTGANTYLKYQNKHIHFFAVDLINQSDRGYNVDQSPVCLKHNQSLFIKLKSCCHLEIKDTNWWVDQMHGKETRLQMHTESHRRQISPNISNTHSTVPELYHLHRHLLICVRVLWLHVC